MTTLYKCGKCLEGRGWITADDGSVFPCSACEPERYERWAAGEFSPSFKSHPGHRIAMTAAQLAEQIGDARKVLDVGPAEAEG